MQVKSCCFAYLKDNVFLLVAVGLRVALGEQNGNNNDTSSFSRLGTIKTKSFRD